jgi:hypothetical protein
MIIALLLGMLVQLVINIIIGWIIWNRQNVICNVLSQIITITVRHHNTLFPGEQITMEDLFNYVKEEENE